MNPYVYGGGGGGGGPGDGVFTFSNAWLLMHTDSVSPVLDSSTYQQGSQNVNVVVSTSVKPFSSGGSFDFTSAITRRVRIGHRDGSWALGTNSWCLSAQVYTSGADETRIFDARSGSGDTGSWACIVQTSTRKPFIQIGSNVYGTGVGGEPDAAIILTANTWQQVDYTYDGTTLRCFVQGNLSWSKTISLNVGGRPLLAIGNAIDGGGGNWNGYLAELLIVVGEPVFTSAHTPRTAEWTDTGLGRQTVATPTGSNIKLLLHFDGNFTDSSTANTKTVTANGGATTSTAQFVFGTHSSVYDGTGDYLTTPDSVDWDFGSGGIGTGDFTIITWARRDTGALTDYIISCYNGPASGWTLGTNGAVPAWFGVGDTAPVTFTSSMAENVWHCLSISRKNGIIYSGFDGVCEDVRVSADTINCATQLYIGRLRNANPQFDWDGYIDELIVVRGEAIVHGSYTVPTSAFANP